MIELCLLQVVSFVDVFLENTEAKKVLCIVPINTIQNWLAEFNYWLPAKVQFRYLPTLCFWTRYRTVAVP